MTVSHNPAPFMEESPDDQDKFLSFKVGEENYGIGIDRVQEIIGMLPVTRIPGTSAVIRGVINLRGKVIPIIDLRIRFGMPPREKTIQPCIVITRQFDGTEHTLIGLIVDEVPEVLDGKDGQMERPAFIDKKIVSPYVVGLWKKDKDITIRIDIDKLLSEIERASLHQMSVDSAEADGVFNTRDDASEGFKKDE